MLNVEVGDLLRRYCGAVGEVVEITTDIVGETDLIIMRILSGSTGAIRKGMLWEVIPQNIGVGKKWDILKEQGEDDDLPPAPTSVSYLDQWENTIEGPSLTPAEHGLKVERCGSFPLIKIYSRGGGEAVYLDADSTLQLSHDLLRMAMEIKRSKKSDVRGIV